MIRQEHGHAFARARSLLSLFLAVPLSTACARGAANAEGGAGGGGAPPPAEVAVVQVEPETVAEPFEFSGQVIPYRRVEVRARVDGIIEERPFTEGMLVEAGQVLYRLDRVRYEAAYRSDLARFQNAERKLKRLEPLLAQHAVAQQDVDNARSEYESSQADLDRAKQDLDDTEVRAGMAGRVGRTMLEVGARVTGSGDLLTTIDRLDPVYVTFRPSTQQLLSWQEDPRSRALMRAGSSLEVQVVLPDGSILQRKGRLDFVAPSLECGDGHTGIPRTVPES